MGRLGENLKRPDEFYLLLKLKMAVRNAEKQIRLQPHWGFCYSMLHKVSRSFALVIQQLDNELRGVGIDLVAGGKSKKTKCTAPKSDDIYLKLLVKLYQFLVQRTGSKFNAVILKRLIMSKVNKAPLSLSRLTRYMQGKEDKIAVVGGTVTDDIRVYDVPAMKVTALRFTETVRARIEKAGGECLTFDQLALRAPPGQNTIQCSHFVL